ncbi:DUF2625 family protein [Taibaiella koreensis]|uniref:DUF2625 family protein n=1 Tax=Taibaiella koreensis TaxID=1268548 RepID=UPI000E5A00B1|nr:DUF2625 family protein [Taibaiella koreensis]
MWLYRLLQQTQDGNLGQFYEGFRWRGREADAAADDGNQVYSFVPFLWSKECKALG